MLDWMECWLISARYYRIGANTDWDSSGGWPTFAFSLVQPCLTRYQLDKSITYSLILLSLAVVGGQVDGSLGKMMMMKQQHLRLIDLKHVIDYLAGRFDGQKIRSKFFNVHFQSSPSFFLSLS
jgi:hypothetical protein